MGIRAACPQCGHNMNLKSFLAGKRGVCPQCRAKFDIPATNGSDANGAKASKPKKGKQKAAANLPETEIETQEATQTSRHAAASVRPAAISGTVVETTSPAATAVRPAAAPSPATQPIPAAATTPVVPGFAAAAHGAPGSVTPQPQPAAAPVRPVMSQPNPTAFAAHAPAPVQPRPAPQPVNPQAFPSPGAQPQPAAWQPQPGAIQPLPVQPMPVHTGPVQPAGYGAVPYGAQPASAPLADPLAEAPNAAWYVRPPSGGQFGPARGDVMRQWMGEGRVTADSLVWREGWPDWKRADLVLPQLRPVPVSGPAPQPFAATQPRNEFAAIGATDRPTKSGGPVVYRRKDSGGRLLAIILLVFALIALTVVFIWVMNRDNGKKKDDKKTTPTPVPLKTESPVAPRSVADLREIPAFNRFTA